ncbi:MAG: hypothetical protein F6K55_43555, partial [Moorea sp. SIO4A3]|nr:hypothetical protein [Moorena sp. SIO4A3]
MSYFANGSLAKKCQKAMQRGLGEPVRSWGGSAVLGRQRGLGEAARSWGGSAVLGRQRGLGEAARS